LHLAGTYLFNMLAKTEILHVPYKGASPALTAAAGNQVDLAFTTLPPAVPLVKSNKVKGIAVTSLKRSPALPDTPTVAESGFPGYEVRVFTGYFMPAGTPQAVGDKFREAVRKVLAMPEIKEKLAKLGFEQADPTENFPHLVADELKMWSKVAKEAKIKIQ
jgi:tripartite-type tricarboxylate transporter receptor subunit TctC